MRKPKYYKLPNGSCKRKVNIVVGGRGSGKVYGSIEYLKKTTINEIKDEKLRNSLWKLTNPEFIENYYDHCECFAIVLKALIDYERIKK